ncbi:hypothetical protein WDU94_005566, partial [Cyamophila willieti]
GRLNISLVTPSWDDEIANVSFGGEWRPPQCESRHLVAVVIPFRDRASHLLTLLHHLHPILQRQLLHYKIFVVEQAGNGTFNKGMLMNAGFKLILQHHAYPGAVIFHCFIFHDVDLLLEDDRNLHSCPPMPRHLSVAVDELGYRRKILQEDFHRISNHINDEGISLGKLLIRKQKLEEICCKFDDVQQEIEELVFKKEKEDEESEAMREESETGMSFILTGKTQWRRFKRRSRQ